MNELEKHVKFMSGSPQFRIQEIESRTAPVYRIYSQNDLNDDLTGMISDFAEKKTIRTTDDVCTLVTGDIIFSLISGTASIVGEEHEGYLYTQNYVKLFTDAAMEPKFLVYLLNEDRRIKKQFQVGLQGSSILKYTVNQLKKLELPSLPSLEKQRLIGDIYFKQMKKETLQKRAAKAERLLLYQRLEELCYEGTKV